MQAESHVIIHANCSLVLRNFYQNCDVSTNLDSSSKYKNYSKMD